MNYLELKDEVNKIERVKKSTWYGVRSEALDWTLSAVIISLLREMFSSHLRSYSVGFVGVIEVKSEEKYLVWSPETLD
jgi:hypothetical protein